MIKEKLEELKKQAIFKKEKQKGELFLVFCIADPNLRIEQIDFSFLTKNKKSKNRKCHKKYYIKNFTFKNGR